MKLTKDQINEIKSQQDQSFSTKRVTAPELEKILSKQLTKRNQEFVSN